jgi:hypothetical protein
MKNRAQSKRARSTHLSQVSLSPAELIDLFAAYGLTLSPDVANALDLSEAPEALLAYEGCALFRTEEEIAGLCGVAQVARAQALIDAGAVTDLSFDGFTINASVQDTAASKANAKGREYHPTFDFDFTDFICDCKEPTDRSCSHLTALMLTWTRDPLAFLPAQPTPDEWDQLTESSFGECITDLLPMDFASAYTLYRRMRQPQAGSDNLGVIDASAGVASVRPSSPARKVAANTSSGAARWPTASAVWPAAPDLHHTIEAEFNTAQLRELAKTLNIKLKGTAKSGFVEQVTQALAEWVRRLANEPNLLLEGLSEDYVGFVRRAFSARDHELPLPRSLAEKLWTQQTNKDPAKRLTDLLENLRRRALLFPSRMYYGYRDVYYQWLPLRGSENVPLLTWPPALVAAKETPRQSNTSGDHFLDAFDLFLNAVLSSGVQVRASLPTHPKASATTWLKEWEHDSAEAERLLNSRPGWVPNPQSGISVPLLSPLTPEARTHLENQTGLSSAQCDFLFAVAAALQLIEAPDPLTGSDKQRGMFKPLAAPWRLQARSAAIEEWFALSNEARFLRAWNAWRNQLLFGVEVQHTLSAVTSLRIMRAIGARDFAPADLAAEWCALRRYLARTLRGLPPGEWISWPDFRTQLFEFYPDCAWAIFSSDYWWFSTSSAGGKMNPNRAPEWQRSIGALLETMLLESFQWFGLIDVAADAKGLKAFRLNEMHQWLTQALAAQGAASQVLALPPAKPAEGDALEHQEQTSDAIVTAPIAPPAPPLPPLPASGTPRPRQAEPVVWLDERLFRLPPAPDRAEQTILARKIAEPGDAPFTYILTPASIERALAAGIGLDEVLRVFGGLHAPMPAAAQALYRAVADHFGRVRLYDSLTVLELADDYALRELLANTSLGSHLIYQISPRAVIIRQGAVDTLVQEMIARGYTPAVKG